MADDEPLPPPTPIWKDQPGRFQEAIARSAQAVQEGVPERDPYRMLDVLVNLERNALADGMPIPRIVVQGQELHRLDGVDHLLLDPAVVDNPAAPIALILHVPCDDCGVSHDKPVTLAPIGADADGVPIDGRVLPGGPH